MTADHHSAALREFAAGVGRIRAARADAGDYEYAEGQSVHVSEAEGVRAETPPAGEPIHGTIKVEMSESTKRACERMAERSDDEIEIPAKGKLLPPDA